MFNEKRPFSQILYTALLAAFVSLSGAQAQDRAGSRSFHLQVGQRLAFDGEGLRLSPFRSEWDVRNLARVFEATGVEEDLQNLWQGTIIEMARFYDSGVRDVPAQRRLPPRRLLPLLIQDRHTGEIVGVLHIIEYPGSQFEIGFLIADEARRRGYARAAAELAIANVRRFPRATVIARTTRDNSASRRLLESLGFHLLKSTDHCQYLLRLSPATTD